MKAQQTPRKDNTEDKMKRKKKRGSSGGTLREQIA
jgi:hypothetical protein